MNQMKLKIGTKIFLKIYQTTNNKDEYFNLLVGKINEAYAKIERTTNVLVKKINEDYSE